MNRSPAPRSATGRQRTASAERSPKRQLDRQRRLLRAMGPDQQFRKLFEHLPDVYFFAKDTAGRHFCVSRSILRKLGLRHETEMLGTTDFDRYPARLAERFRRDDLTVQRTRKPLLNRLEIWYNAHGVLDWALTDKYPIFDRRGRVMGVMGTVRNWRDERPLHVPYTRIGRVLERIRSGNPAGLNVAALAREAGLSTRHLSRRFVELFGVNCREFLLRTRIQRAAQSLLESSRPLAQIALECGFCDQSAFTQQFRARMGVTPLKYRAQTPHNRPQP